MDTQIGSGLMIVILSDNYITGLPTFFTRCVIPSITIQCTPTLPNYQGISLIYWQISLSSSFIEFSLILTPRSYALTSLSLKNSIYQESLPNIHLQGLEISAHLPGFPFIIIQEIVCGMLVPSLPLKPHQD